MLVGTRDQVERPDALRATFAEMLPEATVETVPEAGHLLPIEAPGVIAAVCRAVGAA